LHKKIQNERGKRLSLFFGLLSNFCRLLTFARMGNKIWISFCRRKKSKVTSLFGTCIFRPQI
jgi:hypothetical protein